LLGFVFFRFFGGAAYGDGCEDDDEGYEDGVEELSGKGGRGFAEDSVEEVLDGRVPGQGGDEPERRGYEKGSFTNDPYTSRTSPVNAVSFPTAVVSVRFRGAVRGVVQAVLGVGA
jgi:hypothetical protein